MAMLSYYTLHPLSSSSTSLLHLSPSSSTSSQSLLRTSSPSPSKFHFLSSKCRRRKPTKPKLLMIINPFLLFNGFGSAFYLDTQTLIVTVSVLAAIALSLFLGLKVTFL